VGRCTQLEWLELTACPRVSDAGIKQVGLLAGRQGKARQKWEADGRVGPAPRALAYLDLGGLVRLSDTALHKLVQRTSWLRTLDLRGCAKLTAAGLTAALASDAVTPSLSRLTLTACPAATSDVLEQLQQSRPHLLIVA
jgi:hypothetical protein